MSSRWPLSAALNAADDGNSGAGGGRETDRCLLAETCDGDARSRMACRSNGVLSIGGAQAVAAMAFGTETISKGR